MPEIRKDPVLGRWVIIASERGRRPNAFLTDCGSDSAANCPFCPGHEMETPPAICTIYEKGGKAKVRKGDQAQRQTGGAWRLRVVLNKYPALVSRGAAETASDGVYDRMNGIGSHEVVIETPRHDRQLEDLPVREIADVFRIFILRAGEMKKDPRIKYVMIFKNFGHNAGASLSHPHSQLIAMPLTPIRVTQEIEGAAAYRKKNGSCVFCDVLRQEMLRGVRVVGENGDFLAITPYASRFSFEICILPKKHESHFERMDPASALGLASIVKNVIGKLRASIDNFSYNLIIHSMPVQAPPAAHYHWHIEIMPKLSQAAGFEWGTGFYINTVSPEDAAKRMNKGKKYRV